MNPSYTKVLGSVLFITSLAVTTPSPAQETSAVTAATLKPQALAEGLGLAAAFPGDEAIERDPRVLFVEDFETGTVLELGERWGNASQPENMSFSPDIPPNSPGNRSLRFAKTGHLFTHTRGVDRMHARFYVKFHPKIGYIHHFVTLWADRMPTPWPKGWAGKKPSGDALFSSGIEPWHDWHKYPPPGVWHFLKDNARYHIGGLKQGEWRSVEFLAIEARAGWAADGASLDGAVLNNVKILFEGPPDARLFLDDFEITE